VGWYDGLLRDYLAWLLRRGRSPRTIATWRTPLRDFGRWLQGQHVLHPEALNRLHIEGWQDSIRERGRSPLTAVGAASALKGLLRYAELEREELGIQPGLVWRVVSPRVPEYLPRPIELEDVRTLLQHYARPSRDLVFLRDRALFAVLLTSGARISEALQMRVDQFARRSPIEVLQKGGRQKRLVISETARTWIEQYLRVRGSDEETALWIRELGPGISRGRPRAPISQNAVNLRWHDVAQQLGIRHFTSHRLRHTAGTQLLEQGARELEVASVLGHANLNMIRRYVLVQEGRRQELANGLDALIPAAPAEAGRIVGFRRPRRRVIPK